MENTQIKYIVVIPSLNPGVELIALVDKLIQMGTKNIVIVNDASDKDHIYVFHELAHYENIIIMDHDVNLGKGAALKTAFAYCTEHFRDITGVVTADCDGQHTPQDIFKVAEALSRNPDSLILGVRNFKKSTTPPKSYLGNRTISRIVKIFYGIDLSDTQTGLRGIPLSELEWMSKMEGQRYDYELTMLIQAKRRNINIKQIPIEVLYFNNNEGSHFHAVIDTVRIAKILLFHLFTDTGKEKLHYGKLFYFCRSILRLFYKKLTIANNFLSGPLVFVGHHQNLKSALRTMIWLDIPVRIWMLGVFCDKESCYNQYAGYTFTQRMGWNKIYANITAFILARFIPKLAESMRVIPVYRNSVKGLHVTVSQSVDALCTGKNLLVFPDVDYTSESDLMGEMYTGFISLDKYYYKKTGRHIKFVPLRANMEKSEIRFGQPSSIRDDESYRQAKNRIAKELQEEMNTL